MAKRRSLFSRIRSAATRGASAAQKAADTARSARSAARDVRQALTSGRRAAAAETRRQGARLADELQRIADDVRKAVESGGSVRETVRKRSADLAADAVDAVAKVAKAAAEVPPEAKKKKRKKGRKKGKKGRKKGKKGKKRTPPPQMPPTKRGKAQTLTLPPGKIRPDEAPFVPRITPQQMRAVADFAADKLSPGDTINKSYEILPDDEGATAWFAVVLGEDPQTGEIVIVGQSARQTSPEAAAVEGDALAKKYGGVAVQIVPVVWIGPVAGAQ